MINMLHLGLSYACNMKCKHCYVDKKNDKLTAQKIKESIDVLLKKGLFIVFYTFGEPFLSPLFLEISAYLKSKDVIQIVMTNGTLINKKNIDIIKNNNINKLYISFDSMIPEKHDSNRNYKNAFSKAKNSLNLLKENKIDVGLAVTINDNNIDEMSKFVDFAIENGINNISFLRQREQYGNITITKFRQYEKFYMQYLKSHPKQIILQFHDPELLRTTKNMFEKKEISELEYNKYIDMNSCNIKNTISIAPNADVLICNLVNKKIGNISEEDLDDILKRRNINECFICDTKFSGKS